MTRRRKFVFIVLTLGIAWMVVEGVSFAAGKVLQRKWAMWRPPSMPAQSASDFDYAQYLARRHPLLGWPYSTQFGDVYAANGAQRNPHFPDGPNGESCVSLYGDSFTEGGDTSGLINNWGNVLSARLNCYVANFGVGGYGTDQAYLRFEDNRADTSPVVILGLHTENVLRNLTRIRDLLNYEQWLALKPRFILNAHGNLELVPIPDLTELEYRRAVGIEGDLLPLEHENFQPGGPGGVVRLSFPFTLSVAKNLMGFHGARARLRKQPEWLEILQSGHSLQGLEIMTGLAQRFVELAEQRQKSSLVVVLPHPADFAYFERTDSWPYQPLIDALAERGVSVDDFGPYLVNKARQAQRPLQAFFGPTDHYEDGGNALVAQFIHERLMASALR